MASALRYRLAEGVCMDATGANRNHPKRALLIDDDKGRSERPPRRRHLVRLCDRRGSEWARGPRALREKPLRRRLDRSPDAWHDGLGGAPGAAPAGPQDPGGHRDGRQRLGRRLRHLTTRRRARAQTCRYEGARDGSLAAARRPRVVDSLTDVEKVLGQFRQAIKNPKAERITKRLASAHLQQAQETLARFKGH